MEWILSALSLITLLSFASEKYWIVMVCIVGEDWFGGMQLGVTGENSRNKVVEVASKSNCS